MELSGTIIRIDTKKTCIIYGNGRQYRAYIRKKIVGVQPGQLRPVAVGDQVICKMRNENEIWVHKLLPRKTWLTRSSAGRKIAKEQVVATNVEQMVIVTSIYAPEFVEGIIDRLLVAAHRGNLAPLIVINKIDYRDREPNWLQIESIAQVYRQNGYPVIFTSVATRAGIDNLQQQICHKSSVFAGHSGVGKSSLVSAIDPNLTLRTQEVNRKSRRGQHTTTSVRLLPLYCGGFVVDTPGIREFTLWQVDPQELSLYYPEFQEHARNCKYRSCTHAHEPQCAVQQGVAQGEIPRFRYQSYRRIIESIKEDQQQRQLW